MAVFLTLTGYWIYIDQAYTPNAGECRVALLPGNEADIPQSSSVSSFTTQHLVCLGVQYLGSTLPRLCLFRSEQKEYRYRLRPTGSL